MILLEESFLGSVEHLYVCQQRVKCWKKKRFLGKVIHCISAKKKNVF